MIEKTANIKGEWKRIGLTEEEYDNIMQKLLENNMKELERIIATIGNTGSLTDNEKLKIISILADKQLMASFTIINSEIDKKTFLMKHSNKEYVKPEFPKQEIPETAKDEKEEEPKMDFTPRKKFEERVLTEEEAKKLYKKGKTEDDKPIYDTILKKFVKK